MSDYYLADGGHVLISGSTGARDGYGGKSVLANWWYSNLVENGWRDLGVYVNPKGHSFVDGRTVRSLHGFAQSYRSGTRVFDYQSKDPDAIVETVRQIGDEAVIVFDEAQMYRDSDALNETLAMYGNLDEGSIRGLVVTQRPWNLSEELRANCPVKIWVGPITNEGHNFFQSEQMAAVANELDGQMDPYHWAVTDAGELQTVNSPVPESYAR